MSQVRFNLFVIIIGVNQNLLNRYKGTCKKIKVARGSLIAVFILPVLFTIIFSIAVMSGALIDLDREFHFWPSGISTKNNPIQILGLEDQYSIKEPISVSVQVSDPSFECGDLYITITSQDNVVTQSGFFEQCFQNLGILPLKGDFSEVIEIPGKYDLKVEMLDKNQKNTITVSGKFTVK